MPKKPNESNQAGSDGGREAAGINDGSCSGLVSYAASSQTPLAAFSIGSGVASGSLLARLSAWQLGSPGRPTEQPEDH